MGWGSGISMIRAMAFLIFSSSVLLGSCIYFKEGSTSFCHSRKLCKNTEMNLYQCIPL